MTPKKALTISLIILGIVLIIAFAAKPAIINFYFDHQATHSINETRTITAVEGYGKVLVIGAEVWYVTTDYFFITDSSGQTIRAHLTDKLNCIPEPGNKIRVAGAWNPTPIKSDPDLEEWMKTNGFEHLPTDTRQENFYAVWIINGCEKQ